MAWKFSKSRLASVPWIGTAAIAMGAAAVFRLLAPAGKEHKGMMAKILFQ